MNEPREPDDEEEFEEDEEEEDSGDPEPEPEPPPPAPPPAPKPVRKTRPRTPAQAHAGLGANPAMNAPFAKTEIVELWGEVLERLRRYPQLGTAYDLGIRVYAADGRMLGSFPASSVQGSDQESPGDALVRWLIENYHLPLSSGAATYAIQIFWLRNSHIYARGHLKLPSPEQLLAMKRANEQRAQQQQAPPQYPPQYPPQGYGSPPSAHGYGPPQGYGPAPGYAPPQPHPWGPQPQGPAPGVGASEREMAMLAELAASRGQIGEMAREMVARAQQAPAGMISQSEMNLRIENAELRARLSMQAPQPAPQAAAPAPSASPAGTGAPSTIMDPVRHTVEGMVGSILDATLRHAGKTVQKALFAGLGATSEDVASAPPLVAEPMEPPKPEDEMPYQTVELQSKWADGRPVVYAKNKESGNIDWTGVALGNPVFMETGMAIGTKIGEAAAAWMQKVSGVHPAPRPEVEIVRSIPRGSVDGTPRVVDPPAQQEPPSASPNGEARKPWPQV
jgi:hypothetical protein